MTVSPFFQMIWELRPLSLSFYSQSVCPEASVITRFANSLSQAATITCIYQKTYHIQE
ncbi:hypothetical protein HanPI659440_Chr13g0486631 [Helianthus annuus]|nr:hypothetical protein HanPI659440_Chr13g0486631 [Helianthus annuus]